MEVQFLGTGAGLPAKFRNTQSFVFDFMQELKECWMFDCGEATQHQILKTNIKPTKIKRIFISHLHADHVLGLIGFLSSRSFLLDKKESEVIIYGPKGIKEFIEQNLKFTFCSLTYSIKYIEIFEEACIIDSKTVEVYAYPLMHNIECFGYKIVFKKQKGSLNAEKLMELGIKPGPFYKKIKEEDQFEYNGNIYNSSDFLSEDKPGKEIAVIPDTKYFSELDDIVKNSDVIITECTYLSATDESHARKNYHLCITDIHKMLSNSKAQKVFLTHISARYDKSTEDEVIEKVCTVFRELRQGLTLDGKQKIKTTTNVLSTAEAISLLANSMALAGSFGDGEISDYDLAAGLQGAIVKEDSKDGQIWTEYLENIMKKRGSEWLNLYKECKELNKTSK